MAFALAASQAPHPGWLNGGTASTARQYFLRPTQHVPNGPRIAAAVSGMAEGELRTVWSDVSGDLFRVRRADDGTLAQILDWNPHMVWHAGTEQFLLGGRRGTIKLTAYSDLTGQWRELPMPADLARNISGTVHWYGNIARDGSGTVYYGTTEAVSQTWAFDPVTEIWTRLADTPSLSQLGSVMEWNPDANSSSGGLMKCLPFGTGTGRMILLNAAGTSWSTIASGFGNGQHALVRHHPSHARMLIVGGTSSVRGATLMTATGTPTAVTNVPDDVVMSMGSWIVAHPSGCWLVRTVGASETLYAAWPAADYSDVTWQDLGTAPDSALTNSTAVWDADRELVFITAESGLFAWRPQTLTAPSGTAAGVTLTAAASLIAGAASAGAAAPGVTLTADAAIIPGAASGAGSGSAAGALVQAQAELLPGAATAGAAAPGALLLASASLTAGTASAGAAAAGALLLAASSLQAGAASASGSATAQGALLQAAAELIAGAATGQFGGQASGALFDLVAAFLRGSAYGPNLTATPGFVARLARRNFAATIEPAIRTAARRDA